MLGSASPTNGTSSITQTFTAPAGSSTLSFWYNLTCPDTVNHDRATAALKDNSTGTTNTVLAKTCAANSGWKQITTAITAGHSYTLTLTSKDDHRARNATYTRYDDAVTLLTGTPAASEISGGSFCPPPRAGRPILRAGPVVVVVLPNGASADLARP